MDALDAVLRQIEPPDRAAAAAVRMHWQHTVGPASGPLAGALGRWAARTGTPTLSLQKRTLLLVGGVGWAAPGAPLRAMAARLGCAVLPVEAAPGPALPAGVLDRRPAQRGTSGKTLFDRAAARAQMAQGAALAGALAAEQTDLLLLESGAEPEPTALAALCLLLGQRPERLLAVHPRRPLEGPAVPLAAQTERLLARLPVRPRRSDPAGLFVALDAPGLALLTGLVLGGAAHRLPVLLTGTRGAAAALAAQRLAPAVGETVLAACADGPAASAAFAALQAEPLLPRQQLPCPGCDTLSALAQLELAHTVYGTGPHL